MGRKKTIETAYRIGTAYLKKRGVESPAFVSELLLRSALNWDRTRLFTHFAQPLDEDAAVCFARWLSRRAKGIPVQYLLGEQEFYGRTFQVGPEVLIPRPETEVLVETVLREADRIWPKDSVTAADLGTGSGAIAVTLAAERPSWQLVAMDRSQGALTTARKNGKRHRVNDRIQWLVGDWLQPLIAAGLKVDIAISNPPYIPSDVIEGLDVEVKENEPRLALDGGPDGLAPYRVIIRQLASLINRPGLIAFEVGEAQSEDVERMLVHQWAGADVFTLPDLAGRPRVVTARIGIPR
ncbi:release factor glutamine methyltransferase [Melghirimyces thermohalophilus]|uniref:Release factor glutamine methyltransferase n=1 Tax=Melghirimyces thermohalophilus TaxID=1236220 RepID=A0A1G6MAR2_9BACL|nr:peptide chain release factor N(5)-glutamine methyltransferase [Melghirimyces thermohalophilus]SDC52550.1 release factor glutamine methyltransferase [Melghirimyces thermohalophilus]